MYNVTFKRFKRLKLFHGFLGKLLKGGVEKSQTGAVCSWWTPGGNGVSDTDLAAMSYPLENSPCEFEQCYSPRRSCC